MMFKDVKRTCFRDAASTRSHVIVLDLTTEMLPLMTGPLKILLHVSLLLSALGRRYPQSTHTRQHL